MPSRKKWLAEPAPIHAAFHLVKEWLRDAPVDAGYLAEDAAWSPVLSSQSFKPGRRELEDHWLDRGSLYGSEVSWWGGPAMAPLPEWPCRPDGTPLAHVLSLGLQDVDSWGLDEREAFPDHRQGLPTTGMLEVFHDLQTYGWEVADREAGAWLVRWVEEPDHSRLVDPPAELDVPTDVCQAGMVLPGFTLRSPSDVVATDKAQVDAVELVTDQLQRTWTMQRTVSAENHPLPVTHVYGHSQNGSGPALRILAATLPLEEPDDSYRLVLDIESWTHLSGWFGDAAPLEVWMRDSDLRARRFDQAWCIIRTD